MLRAGRGDAIDARRAKGRCPAAFLQGSAARQTAAAVLVLIAASAFLPEPAAAAEEKTIWAAKLTVKEINDT